MLSGRPAQPAAPGSPRIRPEPPVRINSRGRIPVSYTRCQDRPYCATRLARPNRWAAGWRDQDMKFMAPVLHALGEPMRVEVVELEDPKAGEVLVRMAASGICHSCLHAQDGTWGPTTPLPVILGDEGSGTVEKVGPGVEHLKPGDHVVISWTPTCGRCHYCVV